MKILRLLPLLLLSTAAMVGQAPTPKPAAAPAPAAPVVTPALTPVDWKSDPAMTEFAKQAGSSAIAQWMAEFLAKSLPAKRYALLPLGADLDDGYFTLQARNEFANRALGTDYTLFTRDDAEWKSLLAEVRKGDQEGDTMDAATIQKFGRVQGVQGIIRGRVSGVYLGPSSSPGGVHMADDAKTLQVRIVMQAFEIETGRLLWGAEKIAAVQLPDESLVVPGTKRQWILYGAAGFAGLVILIVIFRALGTANRPR